MPLRFRSHSLIKSAPKLRKSVHARDNFCPFESPLQGADRSENTESLQFDPIVDGATVHCSVIHPNFRLMGVRLNTNSTPARVKTATMI